MQIITKSVHIIDYENGATRTIVPPDAFEEYVSDLISHINDNTTIREFVTTSRRTEVIACILNTQIHVADSAVIQCNVDTIAARLLAKETAAQQRIEHLEIQVQKGSLIQALLYNEATNMYYYLLAKVEHGGFVDDADFSFKSGFSKDKKTIWKTCLIDLSVNGPNPLTAKIYSNTAAKYWWNDFLELTPLTNDETNTQTAFRAIDSAINRLIRDMAPHDHTVIRNTFVSYFKNRDHFVSPNESP